MGKKNKEKFVDDGRTIVDMNVEGTPWYNPSKPKEIDLNPPRNLGIADTFYILKGVLKAAFLLALVFGVCFFIVVYALYLIL